MVKELIYCDDKQCLDYAEFCSFVSEINCDFIFPIYSDVAYEKIVKSLNIIGCWFNNRLIALCLYDDRLDLKSSYICFVAVLPAYRHMHIATSLLNQVEQKVKQKGIKRIGVHTNNLIAFDCYTKLGYVVRLTQFTDEDDCRYYLEKEI